MQVRKAVIPAAGLGTRVLPASKAVPKEMLNIVDKPAIQYIVEEAAHSGITDILIILGRGKGIVEDHFDRAPELEQALETDLQTEWELPPETDRTTSREMVQAPQEMARAPEMQEAALPEPLSPGTKAPE